jgi:hypothetical protein
MIYLVKEKEYQGIYHTDISEESVEMLLSKGAKKTTGYGSKPDRCKLTDEEWKALDGQARLDAYYYLSFDRGILLKESEYVKVFKHVEVLSILEQDLVEHTVKIDLELLSDKIMNKVIANAQHLFNSKLEVHQPNMPLFQYNDYMVLTDHCTISLQEEYIDKGWRVVCICPQPDQRRPDYILGRYTEANA